MKPLIQTLRPGIQKISNRWFSLLISLLGTLAVLYFVVSAPDLARLRAFSLLDLVLLSVMVIAGHFLSSLKFCVSASIFGIRLPVREAFPLTVAGRFINILPMTSVGFSAIYLKKIHGFRYTNFGISILADLSTGFISSGLIGLLGLAALSYQNQYLISPLLPAAFSAFTIGPVLLILTGALLRKRKPSNRAGLEGADQTSRWSKLYQQLMAGLDVIMQKPKVFFYFFAINTLSSLIFGVKYWLVAFRLDYPVSLLAGLVLFSATRIIDVIPLSNGTIGLREAVTALGTAGLGGTAISGVMISAVDRAVILFWTTLLGIAGLLVVRQRIARTEKERPGSKAENSTA